jgi:hypothetical protein
MSQGLLNALFPVALVLLGVAAGVTRLVKKETFDRIPDLLFSICYPCIILQTIGKTDFAGILAENAYAVTLAAILTSLSLLFGWLAARWTKEENNKPVTAFALMINNSAYIGLPVAQLLFGARGVAFVVIYGIVQDLFIWTVGLRMFSKQANPSKRGMILNPVMISLAVALGLSLAGAPEIPVLDDVVATFAGMTVPLALLFLGYVLAGDSAAILRVRGWVLSLSAFKVLAVPAVVFLIVMYLPVDGFYKSMTILVAGLPMPLMTIMLAKQFNKHADLAVELFLCSTALYVPVFAALYSFGVFAL